jgi:hypothetical protein
MPANSAPEESYSTTISVDQTPDEAYAAINDVRGWWSEDIDGPTDTVGREFTYRNEPTHRCTIRVTELVPGERAVWLVVDNVFDFTDDKSEWRDTEVRFDIVPRGDKTEIRFTHIGLVPDYECFEVCSGAWDFYINTSLRGLIRSGQGLPNLTERQTSAASNHV